ncbi:MAG TPA: S8 family serine peptidase, partial [Pyrinomonadaceae bacterium]|nr:S8 family serine peptidase [Pyrinomonadaceae bacterium]
MNLLYPRRFLTKKAVSLTLLLSLVITNAFAVRPVSGTGNKASNTPTSSAIYTTDLTQLGRQGRLRVSLSFEKEVNRLVEVLGKGGVRQPVIVDEKGQSQDEIVDQLAVRIAKGDVPDSLKNRTVVKLMTKVLFSNAKTPQDVDAVVNSVVDQAVASKSQTILYVDELSNFVQAAGGNAKLIDALSKGQISLIGGSIKAAFDNKIGNDTGLAALFEAINVTSDPSSNQNDKAAKTRDSESYRGDNVSPDLREMMQQDPSGKKRVDVILQAKNAENPVLRSMLADGRARITGRIGQDNTLVVNMPLSAIQNLSLSGLINYVSPNRPTRTTGHIESTTGTSLVRNQSATPWRGSYTLDGSGVGIAVLDSGIYASHNSFKNSSGASRIVANVNFTNTTSTSDLYGHGTHVAGIAAGNESSNNGAYRGVAKDANIVSVKVLNNGGQGQTSWLLSGLDWVLQNKATYNIRVVNLSLGGNAIDSYTNDPVCLKVKQLVSNGIVVVAAAGNIGKDSNGNKVYGQIHSPGNSPYVITVGATNSYGTTARNDDTMATFSSHGPTRSYYTDANGTKVYDNVIKPDLVAPGNKIISGKAINNLIASENSLLSLPL